MAVDRADQLPLMKSGCRPSQNQFTALSSAQSTVNNNAYSIIYHQRLVNSNNPWSTASLHSAGCVHSTGRPKDNTCTPRVNLPELPLHSELLGQFSANFVNHGIGRGVPNASLRKSRGVTFSLIFLIRVCVHLSHVLRNPVFGVCDQVRLKPACSARGMQCWI